MTSQQIDWLHQPYWGAMGPIIVITIAAFLVMILEFIFRNGERRWLSGVSLLGVVVALVVAILQFSTRKMLLMTVVSDAFAQVFTILILISAILVFLFTYDYSGKNRMAAEHTYLILFAIVGALTMASAVDMISLYVGLELLSIASYILVGVRQGSIRSVEGGMKYLIMGSIGSAVFLYGLSFLYGISGSTNLYEIAQLGTQLYSSYPAVVVLSFLLILFGLGFKLSLVPFHMWTPDAYDGAPSPVSSFLATLSKTATFGMLLRILLFVFNSAGSHLFYWAGILAAITMVVGNLIALPQRNMKRLLAFSSVAQAGYVLVPFALFGTSQYTNWIAVFDSISFYLFAYTFMTIGAFAIVYVVSRARGTGDSDALLGLYQRSPWLAVALTVFLLSLAGMPLTGGFIGKFYIFTNTVHLNDTWLGVLLFLTSVVSFYYYFGWIRRIYAKESTSGVIGDSHVSRISSGPVMNTLLALCVAGTLVLGLVPQSLMHMLANAGWFS